jgi:hypothetical protein
MKLTQRTRLPGCISAQISVLALLFSFAAFGEDTQPAPGTNGQAKGPLASDSSRQKQTTKPQTPSGAAPQPSSEPDPQSQANTDEHRWSFVGSGFVTTGAKSQYDISVGPVLTSTSDTGKTGYEADVELEKVISRRFSIGGEISYTPYAYSSGGSSDKTTTLTALPKLRFPIGTDGDASRVIIWTGIGLGGASTSIGGQLSGSTSGLTLSVPKRNIGGFAWSPRIGADVEFESWLLRLQAQYISVSSSTPYTLVRTSDLAQVATGNIDVVRSWWAIGLSVGARFDF